DERPDVTIRRDGRALGPEARVERRLVVHRALPVEDRKSAVVERGVVDRTDVAETSVDVSVILEDVAHGVEGLDDGGVVEGDLVTDPLVVDLGTAQAQDHVLDPVGSRPTGSLTGRESSAP